MITEWDLLEWYQPCGFVSLLPIWSAVLVLKTAKSSFRNAPRTSLSKYLNQVYLKHYVINHTNQIHPKHSHLLSPSFCWTAFCCHYSACRVAHFSARSDDLIQLHSLRNSKKKVTLFGRIPQHYLESLIDLICPSQLLSMWSLSWWKYTLAICGRISSMCTFCWGSRLIFALSYVLFCMMDRSNQIWNCSVVTFNYLINYWPGQPTKNSGLGVFKLTI